MDLFYSLLNGYYRDDIKTIKEKIYQYFDKKKDFFYLDLSSEDYQYIFSYILLNKIVKLEENNNYFCVEDISLIIKEKYRNSDKIGESFKNKMLNGDVRITSNTDNIILFNNEYKKIVKDIMIKFLETIKKCNVIKYYCEKEENESVMYKEWKYPNYCIKKVVLGQEIKSNNNYIFNLIEEISFACQKIKRRE